MRKWLWIVVLVLSGCSTPQAPLHEEKLTVLPQKENPESVLMSESPLNAENIEDYLFLENTVYIDTREVNQFNEEGHIAGFVNIPFYEAIAGVKQSEGVLYNMDKHKDAEGNVLAGLGEIGSFQANYIEAESMIHLLFPLDKNIVFMSTAGVEATYLMNLLVQLGYDASKLYNGGCYSNGMGDHKAYRLLDDVKYKVEGQNAYTLEYQINWGDLTLISNETTWE